MLVAAHDDAPAACGWGVVVSISSSVPTSSEDFVDIPTEVR
jgi:hypothetical protein